MPLVWKLAAFLKRDLATDVSYRLSFALEAMHVGITVAAFFFFAQLLGTTRPQGYASFPFLLVGMTVNAYMTTCLVCFSQAIKGSQLAGTLKAVLTTPTSPTTFLVCSSVYPYLRASLDAGVYLIIGMAFGVPLSGMNLPAAVLVLLLSLLAFSSIGILSATFTLIFKRGDPLLWLFGSGSWLLGGVLYPVDYLPTALRHVSALLPITHAVNGMRAAVLDGAPPGGIAGDLGRLAIFAAIGVPLSLAVFGLGVRRARRDGTLDHW